MTAGRSLPWKRMDYLVHRWIGVVLGTLVAVWFMSGAVMVFYPWPALTESARLRLLSPFTPDDSLIGFARAKRAAEAAIAGGTTRESSAPELVGATLIDAAGRQVYRFWSERDGTREPQAAVDARTGRVLSPVDSALAVAAARAIAPADPVASVDRLARGDRYMMNRDYALEFPAWRVRFTGRSAPAVYVSERDGSPFGLVTRRTRVTTWLGTVPHWLYFRWLYERRDLWQVVSIALSATAVLLAITGITLGTMQLYPRRRNGPRRLTPYRGVSRWHHLAGIGFGILVLTWTFSGVLQMLGGSNLPEAGQAARIRGGAVHWSDIRLSEAEALRRTRTGMTEAPIAVDFTQLEGRPGYRFRFRHGPDAWVDGTTGDARLELSEEEARRLAARIFPGVAVAGAQRLSAYDTYYYARAGREMHLPAWRVQLADRERSVVYLDPVDGSPTGFVNGESRRTRWLRDALHSFDYSALNTRPVAWRSLLLALLAGGAASSLSGVVLAWRRVRRIRKVAAT